MLTVRTGLDGNLCFSEGVENLMRSVHRMARRSARSVVRMPSLIVRTMAAVSRKFLLYWERKRVIVANILTELRAGKYSGFHPPAL
jgi:hypothetical protein